jgi:chromosome segregation ATPase
MATQETPATFAKKLADIDVSVTEIEPELPKAQFDRLRMRSPIPYEQPATVINKPYIETCPVDSTTYRPRDVSPACSVRSSFNSTRRRVTHGHHHSEWSYGNHRSEVSREITFQAESEFSALMELMAGISRRSSSLREVWTKIISERDTCYAEMDRMSSCIEECTEIIERKERESHSHTHEHEERKAETTKLKLEITAAIAITAEYKKKLSDRDCELGEARRELAESKDVYKHTKEEHEETKTRLEQTSLLLVATEERYRHAEDDAKRHACELRDLQESYSELEIQSSETTSKYESTKSEFTSIKQNYDVLKKEKHAWLHEKGEFEEGVRKCTQRHDETKRRLKDTIELYEKAEKEYKETIEKKEKEVRELHEKDFKLKSEKKELEEKIKVITRNYDDEHCKWEDAEEHCGRWKLKWEHSEREIVSIREELRIIEIKQTELRETVTKRNEEVKKMTKLKDHFERDYHGKCKETADCHREILVHKETIRRHESTIKEKSEEVHTLHERMERYQSECDTYRGRGDDYEAEATSLQALIVSLKLELSTVNTDHECTQKKLHECETRYNEICETYEEFQDGSSGFEFQISQLRTMLREVREEKERAISARVSADHDRDEAVARYEAKCRDLEQIEEYYSHHFSSHGGSRSGGRTVRRGFKATSTTTVGERDEAASIACAEST